MRILVTGGAGYLGQEVVRRAAAVGWSVRATWLTRRPDLDVEWVRADVRDADALTRAARDVDAVVHTAYRQDDDPWSNNVDGSRAVARAARGARLVHLSTDVVFRGGRGYIGTELLKDVEQPGRYVVVDRWESRETYNAFVEGRRDEYMRRVDETRYLYDQELRFGTFENVWEA